MSFLYALKRENLMEVSYRVWMIKAGLLLMGSEPSPLKLQSAWTPLQRQPPRHSVRLVSFFQVFSPLGSRCWCQESRLGLAEARTMKRTKGEVRVGTNSEAMVRRQCNWLWQVLVTRSHCQI